MKQLIFTCCLLSCLFFSATAQVITFNEVPSTVNYQGVARNAQGQPIASQPIKVRVSLHADSETGHQEKFYSNVYSVTTNPLGLFSLQLNGSGGSNIVGSFYNQAWTNPDYIVKLQIELDINNSGTYTDMGSQRIVSVPYAWISQYAKTAENFRVPTSVFQANSTNGQLIPVNSTGTTVSFETQEFNNVSNFNTSTSVYTSNAVNHHVIYAQARVSHPGTPAANEAMQIQIKVNNVVKATSTVHLEKETTISVSAVTLLFKNDQVKIDVVPINATAEATVGAIRGSHFYIYEIR